MGKKVVGSVCGIELQSGGCGDLGGQSVFEGAFDRGKGDPFPYVFGGGGLDVKVEGGDEV